jgi:SAM-dependent methyltransferase
MPGEVAVATVLQDADLAQNALSYRYNGGGLNNQKLALFGLFLKAWRDGPRRVILPDLRLFDHRLSDLSNYGLITFDEALQRGPLRAFAARHGIEILDLPPQGDEGGWDYFHEAMNYIPRAALLGDLTPESFVCDFLRSLVPAVEHAGLAQRVINAAFGRQGIRLALQLRIETDWADHVAHRLGPAIAVVEDNGPTFPEIVRKICNTAPVNGRPGIYVVCDEAALPVPKEDIRGAIRREFGIDLFWKSDLIAQDELAKLSLLDLSMLDFELCLAAESFVGLTRSTFSNMVALEKYSRTQAPVERHYIYNMLGPRLALRTDNGAFEVPELAAAADPWDQAHSFHVAQVFQAAGDRERALERYCARAEAGFGDREEIYVSLYRAAQIKVELGAPAGEVIATYLRAAAILPSRAEARHGASRHARLNNMFKEGYEIAAPAIDLAAPPVGRFVERWIYEWALLDEYAINAYWADRFQECLDACERLLREGKLFEPQRERVEANARFARTQLGLTALAPAETAAVEASRSDDNLCHRGVHYLDFLQALSASISPASYLEIGTATGASLARFACDAICIDPALHLNGNSIRQRTRALFFQMTSDDFFAQYDLLEMFPNGLNVAFLDGMHHFEYLLRDFINTERCCRQHSLILLHDCLPVNMRMAERELRIDPDEAEETRLWWTGDVWRLLPALKKYRPDLRVTFLDCPPTGLVAITNLDPQSAILQQEYRLVVDEFGAVDLSSYGLKRLWSLFPTLDTRDLVAIGTIGSVFSLREAGSCARILRTPPSDSDTADAGSTANSKLGPCFNQSDGSPNVEERFTKIYQRQDWGHGSGVGARPDRTAEYRAFLQRFIVDNHVRSVVDLGCGDWQFSQHLDWRNVRYLGIDVVAEVVERNRREFARDNIAFENFESLASLPPADLLLCKDVLQHLPNELVKEYLATFKRKYKLALITNDDEPKDLQNIDIDVGGWRTLCLEKEPFSEPGTVVLAWTVEWGSATTRKSTFLVYGDGMSVASSEATR